MSFESFQAPEITPDEEQAKVWSDVKKHFETALEGEEENTVYDEESMIRLHEVLDAIDEQDYSKAFEQLEREIDQLKNRYEWFLENKLAKEVGTSELIQEEIEKLEELKNSLLLEER